MEKQTKDKVKDLVPFFSTIMTLFVLVLVWNFTGWLLAAVSIVGSAAFLLKLFVLGAILHLDGYRTLHTFFTLIGEGVASIVDAEPVAQA